MARSPRWHVTFFILLACIVIELDALGSTISLDLFREEVSTEDARAIHAVKHSQYPKTIHETSQAKYWHYNYTIGAGHVKMVVDTGSADVIVIASHMYHPSRKSVNLHKRFNDTFATTHPDGSGERKLYGELFRDLVGVKGLQIPNQIIGVTERRVPQGPSGAQPAKSHGVFGLAGRHLSDFAHLAHYKSWFHHVCSEKGLKECRFGLAFGQNDRGKQILGGIDDSLFSGVLKTAKLQNEWNVYMDVVAGNTTYDRNIFAITDSGTTTIIAPLADVKRLFKQFNITPLKSNTPKSLVYRGHFACDKPPRLAFRLPASKEAAGASAPADKRPETFYIPPLAMINERIGNNRCIAALEANSLFNQPKLWLVGQPFFQGLYIDHNVGGQTMGFANLK